MSFGETCSDSNKFLLVKSDNLILEVSISGNSLGKTLAAIFGSDASSNLKSFIESWFMPFGDKACDPPAFLVIKDLPYFCLMYLLLAWATLLASCLNNFLSISPCPPRKSLLKEFFKAVSTSAVAIAIASEGSIPRGTNALALFMIALNLASSPQFGEVAYLSSIERICL